MKEEKILNDARISDPTLTVTLAKIEDRFMTQIIFKMVDWKKEMVKNEGEATKDEKIV